MMLRFFDVKTSWRNKQVDPRRNLQDRDRELCPEGLIFLGSLQSADEADDFLSDICPA